MDWPGHGNGVAGNLLQRSQVICKVKLKKGRRYSIGFQIINFTRPDGEIRGTSKN